MGAHFKGGFENKKGLYVEVRGDNIDTAIRNLNRKVKLEGIIKDLRKKEFYEKPSVKKRRKKAEARLRLFQAQKKALEEV
jgi:small subunit ribosomal protein S21